MLCLFVVSIVSSCGDDKKDDNVEPVNPITPVTPTDPSSGGSGTSAMTPTAQKEYLETVAKEFMSWTPASDFKSIADLGSYIRDTYVEGYKYDRVEDWATDIFDDLLVATGVVDKETDKYEWDGYSSTYNYYYTNYTALVMLSNFKGHFTAGSKRWTYSEADDLQFIFNDKQGKQCVLKLTYSGNVTKVHAFRLDDWQDYDYSYSDDYTKYVGNDYYDRTEYTIGLPENIIVTLTQNGSAVVTVTTTFNLSNLKSEEFDISSGKLSATTKTEFNNGYVVDVSQLAYSGNSKTAANYSLTKNGTTLLTLAASSDISGLPSVTASTASTDDFDEDDYNWDNSNGKNAYVLADILGKVQIQGSISDIRKFADYLDKAEDNDTKESSYKSYINQANSLMSAYIFYNGTSTAQAEVTLEPFVDEYWYGNTYWTFEPVLNFYDGSSYSTFEAFFNETDFKSVINRFENLIEDYSDLIDD